MLTPPEEILTKSCPVCPLCGGPGVVRYQGLSDRLFGVAGRWNFKECADRRCRLLWLDPMPAESELEKLYLRYYTHDVREGDSVAKRVYRRAINAYLADKFGYSLIKQEMGLLGSVLRHMLYLYPGARAEAQARVMSLPFKAGGRLLEVGFGNAQTLVRLRELGWEVEGVEFDSVAVANARALGLTVHLGSLASVPAEPGSFDAVISSHVIEHVPDPLGFFRDCHRLLNSAGVAVAYTPNAASLGHRLFGRNWRGLEPPRHLHIFNQQSLSSLVRRAGFQTFSCTGTPRGGIILLASMALARNSKAAGLNGAVAARMLTEIGNYVSWLSLKVNSHLGEELVLIARKDVVS